MKKKLVSILLVLVMVLCLVPTAMAEVSPTEAEAYAATRSLLSGRKMSYTWAGNGGADDWDVFGLARDGVSIPQSYIDSVKKFTPSSDDSTIITDCARAILALTACGETIDNELLKGVTNKDNMDAVNELIFSLLALDSKKYTVPDGGMSRNELRTLLLSAQDDNGAWGWFFASGTDWNRESGSSVDETAQAITALAPYYSIDNNVKSAVDNALVWLKEMQKSDGSFGYSKAWGLEYYNSTVESTAQVIVALTALGIDPANWNGGKNAVSAMCDMAVPAGGGFTYSGSFNEMSTYQGYYALVAYERFKAHKNALYNMTDAMPQTYPHYHPVPAASAVSSAQTADTGILLYATLSVMSLLGMGYVGKKRH